MSWTVRVICQFALGNTHFTLGMPQLAEGNRAEAFEHLRLCVKRPLSAVRLRIGACLLRANGSQHFLADSTTGDSETWCRRWGCTDIDAGVDHSECHSFVAHLTGNAAIGHS